MYHRLCSIMLSFTLCPPVGLEIQGEGDDGDYSYNYCYKPLKPCQEKSAFYSLFKKKKTERYEPIYSPEIETEKEHGYQYHNRSAPDLRAGRPGGLAHLQLNIMI